MKLTRNQLKRIVNESVSQLIREFGCDYGEEYTPEMRKADQMEMDRQASENPFIKTDRLSKEEYMKNWELADKWRNMSPEERREHDTFYSLGLEGYGPEWHRNMTYNMSCPLYDNNPLTTQLTYGQKRNALNSFKQI